MRQTQGTQASGHCQKLVSVARAGPFVGLLTDSTRLAEVRGRLGTVCAGAVVQGALPVASSLGTSWQAVLASEVEGASSHLAFRSLRALVVLSTSRSCWL
jgi:hypothetical protein